MRCFSLVIMKMSPVIEVRKRSALMMDEDGSGAQEEPSKKKKKKKKKATGDGKAELVQGADKEDQPVGNTEDVEMGNGGTAEATGTSKAPHCEHALDYLA